LAWFRQTTAETFAGESNLWDGAGGMEDADMVAKVAGLRGVRQGRGISERGRGDERA